jgi:hypothetical protein
MMMTLALVLISLMALVLMYAVRGKTSPVAEWDDLIGHTRPVDIDAFRNLIDPAEEDFLRRNLPTGEFRVIQRERLRAAVEYVSCAAHNAAVLVRLGEAARASSDPKIAQAGRQLLDSALRLRLYALLSMIRLYLGIAFPGAHLSAGSLADNYQHLSTLAGPSFLCNIPTVPPVCPPFFNIF